ncbi:hypothetical protein VZT92_022704 [Zoarces viviparus]|uniref:Uncharacterized protein n=1 Tax=Zoarces viviparus TaxID=48416 RepID=A0AAW1ED32_ZOAVI
MGCIMSGPVPGLVWIFDEYPFQIRPAVQVNSDPDPFCGSVPEPMIPPGQIRSAVSLLSGEFPGADYTKQ